MVRLMKEKISYIVMSVLFYNFMFIFLYYFKIVSYLYVDVFNLNKYLVITINNLFLILIDILFIYLYKTLKLYKLSYFFICIIGAFIGAIISVLVLKFNKEFSDYLAIVSYSIINTIFLAYSLYFEKNKEKVFV